MRFLKMACTLLIIAGLEIKKLMGEISNAK